MTDYRPRYFTMFRDKPRSFVVKDSLDAVRFMVASQTGTLLSRSMTKGVLLGEIR